MSPRFEISKRLLLINSASSVVAKVVNVSVLVWLYHHLTARISPEACSLLPVLTGAIVLLPMVTSVLTSGLGRYVLAAYAKGDEREVTQIVSTMFVPLMAMGVVLLAGGLLFSWQVHNILSVPAGQERDAQIMMALLVFSAAIRAPFAAFSVGLYVRQKFVLQDIIKLCSDVVRLSLLFILLLGVSTRVLWVVVASTSGEVLSATAILIASKRLVPALKFRPREIRWELMRELVSFGGWNFLAVLAYRLRQMAMPLIFNELATAVDVMAFKIGTMGRQQIDQWSYVASAPLYPVVTGMHAMGAKDRIRNLYIRGGRINLWVTLVVAVPAMIYARELILLYVGEQYIAAAPVMVFSLAGLPISHGASMVWQVAHATGQIRPVGLRNLGSQLTAIAVVLYVVGVAGQGAVGAALAALIVGCISTVVLVWPLGLKLADVKFSIWVRRTLIPGLAPAAVAALVWVAMKLTVSPDTWLKVGACTLVGALCYGVVLLRFCLAPKDRTDLAETVAKVKGWARTPRIARRGA
jgi:O-antigen/teichoic acid export membrane protein